MSNSHHNVLADLERAEQFSVLSKTRRLFHDFNVQEDSQGVVWAVTQAGRHSFAVSLLGPGWVFDPYAKHHRATRLAELYESMKSADSDAQHQRLEHVVSSLRLGIIAARVLWAIHSLVMAARSSAIRIPHHHLARLVWGSNKDAWPQHWRRTLRTVLKGLAQLHVARTLENEPLAFGQDSALITHTADLKGSPQDGCDDDCPEAGGPPHSHYFVNTGRGFLGDLEQFGQDEDETGVRTYVFKVRGRKNAGPTLRSVGKTGKLVTIYLPAKLGEPDACKLLNNRQHRMLQAIVRETTRKTKSKRSDLSEADTFTSDSIPGVKPKESLICDLLDPDVRYVGFNGNGKRQGMGYGLVTAGGWSVKAGYRRDDVVGFFEDLAVLTKTLGLIIVGIHFPTKECLSLEQLQSMTQTHSGRSMLQKTHLRIYSQADYVERWNTYFGWKSEPAFTEPPVDPSAALVTEMKRLGIKRRALAQAINIDPSFLSKILRGTRRWPAEQLEQAEAWVADQGDGAASHVEADGKAETSANNSRQPAAPLLAATPAGVSSMLDVAMAYRSRGWSVVPQQPGEKHPCVKWKEFQQRLATEGELASWFEQWPEAGLAVVLGPVSGLLVVDVDGSAAHNVLLERLGGEPLAPKVISGSCKPDRYHLFFKCPDVPTKAKATPWHSQLEFRGQGGIVVLPPSQHPSGNRYEWAQDRSVEDLSLPELPVEIVTALQPSPSLSPPTRPVVNMDTKDASPSTRDFLAGTCAQGPRWNERLFSAACDLAGRGMARDEAEPLLLSGAQPWDATETETARRTIASAFNEPRKPAKY